MPMYNLIEYSRNYRQTTGSLWNYCREKPNNPPAANYNADPITNSESFKCKISITGKRSNPNQEDSENTEQGNTKTKKTFEIVVPLKHLSILWRSLAMPFINCEVSLALNLSGNCVLTDITTQTARATRGDNPARPAKSAPLNATFKKQTQNYVYRLLLYQMKISTENDKRHSEQLRAVFKRTIKWNKYRSKMTNLSNIY